MSSLVRTALLAGAIGAFSAAPALAQIDEPMTFTTAFPFIVDSQVMPAGQYQIRPLGDEQGLLQLSRLDGKGGVFVQIESMEGRAPHDSQVIFDRYGSKYVLRTVRQEDEPESAVVAGNDEQELAAVQASLGGHEHMSARLSGSETDQPATK